MRNLKGCVEYEIHPSAEDISEVFWAMDAEEQAGFFNKLGEKNRLVFQLQAVTDSVNLNGGGRYAMSRIGEYSAKALDNLSEEGWREVKVELECADEEDLDKLIRMCECILRERQTGEGEDES